MGMIAQDDNERIQDTPRWRDIDPRGQQTAQKCRKLVQLGPLICSALTPNEVKRLLKASTSGHLCVFGLDGSDGLE